MRAEDFRDLLDARPFVPFRIHMSDGKTYDIQHPELLFVLRSRIIIGIPPDQNGGIPDRVEHCSLLHVVRVEELPNPPRSATA